MRRPFVLESLVVVARAGLRVAAPTRRAGRTDRAVVAGSVLHRATDLEQLSEIGQHRIDAQCHPDLRRHGVLAGTGKGFDFQILFDPLEEQFDLPTFFVTGSDGACRKREIVGEEEVALTRFGIAVGNTAQPCEFFFTRLLAGEFNRLIADQAR